MSNWPGNKLPFLFVLPRQRRRMGGGGRTEVGMIPFCPFGEIDLKYKLLVILRRSIRSFYAHRLLSSDEKRLIRLFRCLSKGQQSALLWKTSEDLVRAMFSVRDEAEVDEWLLQLGETHGLIQQDSLINREAVVRSLTPIGSVLLGSTGGHRSQIQAFIRSVYRQLSPDSDFEFDQDRAREILAQWRARALRAIERASRSLTAEPQRRKAARCRKSRAPRLINATIRDIELRGGDLIGARIFLTGSPGIEFGGVTLRSFNGAPHLWFYLSDPERGDCLSCAVGDRKLLIKKVKDLSEGDAVDVRGIVLKLDGGRFGFWVDEISLIPDD